MGLIYVLQRVYVQYLRPNSCFSVAPPSNRPLLCCVETENPAAEKSRFQSPFSSSNVLNGRPKIRRLTTGTNRSRRSELSGMKGEKFKLLKQAKMSEV